MKNILLLFLIFLVSCSPSEEERNATELAKKIRVDDLYSGVLKIPASQPCKNLEGYRNIQSLEKSLKTSHYFQVAQDKIIYYEKKCDQFLLEERQQKEREEELNKLGEWVYGHYVDEFGDKTESGYIGLRTLGSFSNSATEDSPLGVRMFINDATLSNDPWFRLYEYNGRNPLKGTFSNNPRKCRIRLQSKETHEMYLLQGKGEDHLEINNIKTLKDGISALKSAIRNEELVKFSCIDYYQYSSSSYKFSLDFKYFNNVIRKYKSEN